MYNKDYDYEQIKKRYQAEANKLQNANNPGNVSVPKIEVPKQNPISTGQGLQNPISSSQPDFTATQEEREIQQIVNQPISTSSKGMTVNNGATYGATGNSFNSSPTANNAQIPTIQDYQRVYADMQNNATPTQSSQTPINSNSISNWGTNYRGYGGNINDVDISGFNSNQRDLYYQDKSIYDMYVEQAKKIQDYNDSISKSYDTEKQRAYIEQQQMQKNMPQQLKSLGLNGTGASETTMLNMYRDTANRLGEIDNKYTGLREDANTNLNNIETSIQTKANDQYKQYADIVESQGRTKAVVELANQIDDTLDLNELDTIKTSLKSLGVDKLGDDYYALETATKDRQVAVAKNNLYDVMDDVLKRAETNNTTIDGKYDYFDGKRISEAITNAEKYAKGDQEAQQTISRLKNAYQTDIGEYLEGRYGKFPSRMLYKDAESLRMRILNEEKNKYQRSQEDLKELKTWLEDRFKDISMGFTV